MIGRISAVWEIFLPIKFSYPSSVTFQAGKTGRFKDVHEPTQGLIPTARQTLHCRPARWAGNPATGRAYSGQPGLRSRNQRTLVSEQRVRDDAEGGDGAGVTEAVDRRVRFFQDRLRVAKDAVVVEQFAESAFAFGEFIGDRAEIRD